MDVPTTKGALTKANLAMRPRIRLLSWSRLPFFTAYFFITSLSLAAHHVTAPTSRSNAQSAPESPATTGPLTFFTSSLAKAYGPIFTHYGTLLHILLLPLTLLITTFGHQLLSFLLAVTTILLTYPLFHALLQSPSLSLLPTQLTHPPLSMLLSVLPSLFLAFLSLKLIQLALIAMGAILGLIAAAIVFPSLRTKSYVHYLALATGAIVGAVASWCVLTEIVVITTAFAGAAGFVVSLGYFAGWNVEEMVWGKMGKNWGVKEWGIGTLWMLLGCFGVGLQLWITGGGWKRWRRKVKTKKDKYRERGGDNQEKERLVEIKIPGKS